MRYISISEVIEWKYGPVAGTKQKDPNDKSQNPEMVITRWKHPTISQPSNEQLKEDIAEYQAYLDAEKSKVDEIEISRNILIDKYRGKKKGDITTADFNEWGKLAMAQDMGLGL